MIGQNVPIALLPMGTANNISKSLGVYGSPESVIARWAESRRKRFDAGLISTPWGDARFLEGVGIGLFSKAMSILDITDDKKQHEFSSSKDKFLLIEAMNTNFLGPNLRLAVGADPGDGQLDLVSVTEDEREKMEAYLANCLCGKESASDISIRRGRHLQIYLDRDELHVDDRIWPDSQYYSSAARNGPVLIDIKLQPGALEMLV
jgi:diacylglycerol kinase family enzyme